MSDYEGETTEQRVRRMMIEQDMQMIHGEHPSQRVIPEEFWKANPNTAAVWIPEGSFRGAMQHQVDEYLQYTPQFLSDARSRTVEAQERALENQRMAKNRPRTDISIRVTESEDPRIKMPVGSVATNAVRASPSWVPTTKMEELAEMTRQMLLEKQVEAEKLKQGPPILLWTTGDELEVPVVMPSWVSGTPNIMRLVEDGYAMRRASGWPIDKIVTREPIPLIDPVLQEVREPRKPRCETHGNMLVRAKHKTTGDEVLRCPANDCSTMLMKRKAPKK